MESVSFLLNENRIETEAPAGLLLLDFLRNHKRLVGTKEGCKEGDCGACSVLVGELDGDQVRYRPMTSCLIPLGEMHGRHVVTVEGVADRRKLNPAQAAMVSTGGSQCGFCTPGFIVSMTWYLLDASREAPNLEGFKRAISGNLCRCTGYGSILRAGQSLVDDFSPGGKYDTIWKAEDRATALADAGMIPEYFKNAPSMLAEIEPEFTGDPSDAAQPDFIIGGGTDLYVQQGEHIPTSRVAILNRYPEMRGMRRDQETLVVGALTTFEEFAENAIVRQFMPDVDHFMWLIASLHLRNRATLVGNIINASPIGDMTAILLALDTELVMRFGDSERVVRLKDFYQGYKVYDKKPHEVVTEIRLPIPSSGTVVNFEKVSKRKALDIASANGAAKMRLDDDGTVAEFSAAAGGVAPIPLWLEETGRAVVGRKLDRTLVAEALEVAMGEIAPISDVRGSADYKRLLTRQFLIAHFLKLSDGKLSLAEVA